MIALLFVGIIQALFTAGYLLIQRPARLNNRVIALFMVFLALPMITEMGMAGALPLPEVLSLVRSFPFAYGPFLYLYTIIEVSETPRFRKIFLLHFIPFIIITALSPLVPNEQRPDEGGRRFERPIHEQGEHPRDRFRGRQGPGGERPEGPPPPEVIDQGPRMEPGPEGPPPPRDSLTPAPQDPRPLRPEPGPAQIVLSLGTIASIAIYSLLIIMTLRRHRRRTADYYSYDSMLVSLSWLRLLVVCFMLAFTYIFLTEVFLGSLVRHPLVDPHLSHGIGLVLFIFALSFFSIKQPVLFVSPTEGAKGINDGADEPAPRYEKSGLREEDADRYLETLEAYMRDEKPYLDGDLLIADVAASIAVPKHYLTQVINERLGKNFYNYVNEYRISYIVDKLRHHDYREHSILRIAYDAGFNSKSAFNAIFKKQMGLTPSEYRKRHSGDS